MDLESFNQLDRSDMTRELMKCCGSGRWAELLASKRPFSNVKQMIELANAAWSGMEREDWLEAFSHHPKIGESAAQKIQSVTEASWSRAEQAAATGGATNSKELLAELNAEYLRRFGFIFIICAAGKEVEEIIDAIESRLENDPDSEIRVAAEEQRKIMNLRLGKLL